MTGRRHPAFWPLALVFAVACAWWTFYMPVRPSDIYRAIPAQATIVTSHRKLAARWDAVSANPVTLSLLGALGMEAADVRASRDDKNFRTWLARLAGDHVIFAYVPELGPGGEAGWVFASRLGGRSQCLRWLLSTGRVPGFRKAYDRAGHRVWVANGRAFKKKSNDVISFSLAEGLLIGTISKSVAATADALDCYDGRERAHVPHFVSTRPDSGWAQPGIEIEITGLAPDTIEGEVRGPWAWPAAADGAARASSAGLENVLGDAPLAHIVVEKDLAISWLRETLRGPWSAVVDGLAEQARDSFVFCLLGGDLSGRWKGIKLPTLLAGVNVADDAGALAAVSARLDELNARQRWGLVGHAVGAGSARVQAIQGTAKTWYAGAAESECVAFAATNRWLLFSSNAGGLTNLLQRTPGAPRVMEGNAPAYGWIDLEEGGKTLRLAMAAWSLKLAMDDPAGSQATRQKLNEAKAWIDSAAPLKTLRISVRPSENGTIIEFQAGEEPQNTRNTQN